MPDVMFYEAQGKQCRLCSPFWEDFILSGIQDLGVNPLAEWGGGGGGWIETDYSLPCTV